MQSSSMTTNAKPELTVSWDGSFSPPGDGRSTVVITRQGHRTSSWDPTSSLSPIMGVNHSIMSSLPSPSTEEAATNWEKFAFPSTDETGPQSGGRLGGPGRGRGSSVFEEMKEGEVPRILKNRSVRLDSREGNNTVLKGTSPTSRSKTLSFFDSDQSLPTPPPNPLSRGNSLNKGPAELLRKSTGSWLDRTTERLADSNDTGGQHTGGTSWLDRSVNDLGLSPPLSRSYKDPLSNASTPLPLELSSAISPTRHTAIDDIDQTNSPASSSRPMTPTIAAVGGVESNRPKPDFISSMVCSQTITSFPSVDGSSQSPNRLTPIPLSSGFASSPPSPKIPSRSISRYSTLPTTISTGDQKKEENLPSLRDAGKETPRSNEEGPVPQIGDMIGGYQVIKILGKGAFSRVALSHRAKEDEQIASSSLYGAVDDGKEWTTRNCLVALKLITKSSYEGNERMRRSVIREIEALKAVRHPCLVGLLASFPTPDYTVLVLDYCSGGELFDFLAEWHAELKENLARRIFSELSRAVECMHSFGLVHRDIKLENILLTSRPFPCTEPDNLLAELPTPFVKLTDFGLSRSISESSPLLTTRCGSEAYAAPELIMGQQYDGRKTDAWSLGVVLFAIITGGLPFVEEVAQGPKARRAYLVKIAKGDYKWPEAVTMQSPWPATSFPKGESSAEAQEFAKFAVQLPYSDSANESSRLITPAVKSLTGSLLTRDPAKRASVTDIWDMEWMQGEGKTKHMLGTINRETERQQDSLNVPWARDPEL